MLMTELGHEVRKLEQDQHGHWWAFLSKLDGYSHNCFWICKLSDFSMAEGPYFTMEAGFWAFKAKVAEKCFCCGLLAVADRVCEVCGAGSQ